METVGGLAEVVLPCADLEAAMAFFDQLGFRLDTIMPADDPTVALMVGHGLRLCLDRDATGAAAVIRLTGGTGEHRRLTAPNGTVVEIVGPPETVALPAPTFELTRSADATAANATAERVGRAGMHYRDLLPSRQGGRVIASHIRIEDGGPVADYVHHHRVRFQVIYCRRGWVRVVYEDQGPAFVLEEGDCALQPPHIRHQVLESSPGLEVVEVTCPATHPTHADHELVLPTPTLRGERDFGGQRFVRHRADQAEWRAWRAPGFEVRDTGIGRATDGLAGVRVVRAAEASATSSTRHDADLQVWYVTHGRASLRLNGRPDESLGSDDAVSIPAGLDHALVDCSRDFELLEVTLPAEPAFSSS